MWQGAAGDVWVWPMDGTTRLSHDLKLHDVRLRHGAVVGVGRPVGDARSPRSLQSRRWPSSLPRS